MFKRSEKHITDKDVYQSLPHNRKEAFWDFIKHRKMTLFALSSFTFLFFVPLTADLIFFNFMENVVIANDEADLVSKLISLIFYSMVIMLPCMIVGCLGLAGTFYVVKKLVWQEGINLAVDFFQGIKTGWLHAIINGVILGISLFGMVMGGSYLVLYSPVQPIWTGIGIGALVLIFLFLGMAISINFAQDAYYENRFGAVLKNSFRFLGLLNWRILLIFIFSTGVLIALSAINFVTLIIGFVLFAILNSVVILLYTLVIHSAFDKYINADHYPDMVNKGLYKVEDNDEINKDKEA